MTMSDATAAPLGAELQLDLLNPDPQIWTDSDLAAGLSRTMRRGGASQWDFRSPRLDRPRHPQRQSSANGEGELCANCCMTTQRFVLLMYHILDS